MRKPQSIPPSGDGEAQIIRVNCDIPTAAGPPFPEEFSERFRSEE